jgi:hypothetical protein
MDATVRWNLVLRHYPITTVTSVTILGTVYTPLSLASYQAGSAGFIILDEDEPRVLQFQGMYRRDPITVVYSAGYVLGAVPTPLRQAAVMVAAEIFRSEQWVAKKSVSTAGEVISADMGNTWGMSNRAKAMCQPYRDVNPFRGQQ